MPTAAKKKIPEKAELVQEFVICGKKGCRCEDPKGRHGPYWYAYWWDDGKTRKAYVGKHKNGDRAAPKTRKRAAKAEPKQADKKTTTHQAPPKPPPPPPPKNDTKNPPPPPPRGSGMWDTWSRSILGLGSAPISRADLRTAHRAAALKHHPDRGGSLAWMQAVNNANDYLRKHYGWK